MSSFYLRYTIGKRIKFRILSSIWAAAARSPLSQVALAQETSRAGISGMKERSPLSQVELTQAR